LTSGYHLAFWIAAALVLAAIAVSVTVLQPQATAESEPASDRELDAGEPAYSEAA
jgi:hypothetical protein